MIICTDIPTTCKERLYYIFGLLCPTSQKQLCQFAATGSVQQENTERIKHAGLCLNKSGRTSSECLVNCINFTHCISSVLQALGCSFGFVLFACIVWSVIEIRSC